MKPELWIIAGLGAGALVGVFVKMKPGFGPNNLRALGIVLVAVFVSVLAANSDIGITSAFGVLGAIVGYLFGLRDKSS